MVLVYVVADDCSNLLQTRLIHQNVIYVPK